mgnify:CR=1 FL=1
MEELQWVTAPLAHSKSAASFIASPGNKAILIVKRKAQMFAAQGGALAGSEAPLGIFNKGEGKCKKGEGQGGKGFGEGSNRRGRFANSVARKDGGAASRARAATAT